MSLVRALLISFAFVAACSSSSSNNTNGGDAGAGGDGDVASCATDPRVDTYTANMQKPSAMKTFTATLVSSDPAPPVRGGNTWILKLTDASGKPMAGVMPSVVPFMPDHGHGSTVKPTIMDSGDGSYTIDNVYLFMGGVWRVTIVPTGSADSVAFFFCVPG